MSNVKVPVTDLSALLAAQVASGDLAVIVDVSDTTQAPTGSTKKITMQELATYLAGIGGSDLGWIDLLGDVDGVNDTFTLPAPPANGVLNVSLARQIQFEGLDYDYDDNVTLTFTTPPDVSLAGEPFKALLY
jgi:hypothetical protein